MAETSSEMMNGAAKDTGGDTLTETMSRGVEELKANSDMGTDMPGFSNPHVDQETFDKNLEGLRDMQSLQKGNLPEGYEKIAAEQAESVGLADSAMEATARGAHTATTLGAIGGSAYMHHRLNDYAATKLSDARKAELAASSATGVPGEGGSFLGTRAAKAEARGAAVEQIVEKGADGKYIHGAEDNFAKRGVRRALDVTDSAGKSLGDMGARHAASEAAESAAKKGDRHAAASGVKRALAKTKLGKAGHLALGAGRFAKSGASKAILGGAARLGGRALVGAAFPIGTAISVLTLACDPVVINFARKGINKLKGVEGPDENTPPAKPHTVFLPLWLKNGEPDLEGPNSKTNQAAIWLDEQLATFNDKCFDFEPDHVWPAQDAKIPEIGTFDEYNKAYDELLQAIVDAVDASMNTFSKYSEDEVLVSRLLETRLDFLNAMTVLPEEVLLELVNGSVEAQAGYINSYQILRECIFDARAKICGAQTSEGFLGLVGNPLNAFWPKQLDHDDLQEYANKLTEYADKIDAAHTKMTKAGEGWKAPTKFSSFLGSGNGDQSGLPGIVPPGEDKEGDKEKDKENQANPAYPMPGTPRIPSTPFSPATPRMAGSLSMPSPFGPGGGEDKGGGFNPPKITTPDPVSKTPSFPDGIDEKKKFSPSLPDIETPGKDGEHGLDSDDIKTDQSKVTGPTLPNIEKDATVNPNGPTLPKVDTSTKISSADSGGLPPITTPNTDRGPVNTPKVDTDTPKPSVNTPTAPNVSPVSPASPVNPTNLTNGVRGNTPPVPEGVKPASMDIPKPGDPLAEDEGEKKPEEEKVPADPTTDAPEFEDKAPVGERENTKITRDGQTYDLNSSKAAKLAEMVSPTNGDEPKSLREAMADAGYKVPDPGADLGTRVSPMDLKPGDLVVGAEAEGVYIGDGQVLTSDGIKPLAEVADFRGDGHGFFRPDDVDVEAESAATGQDSSAAEDFDKADDKGSAENKTSGLGLNNPLAGGGVAGGAVPGGAGAGGMNKGNRASVTSGKDPFDPGGSSTATNDPFSRISVTGTGGVGGSFGTNVPTGD